MGTKRGTRPRKSHKHDGKFKPATGNPLIDGMLTPHGRYLPPDSYAKQIAGGIASSQHFEPKLPLWFNNQASALEHSTHSTLNLLQHKMRNTCEMAFVNLADAPTLADKLKVFYKRINGVRSCSYPDFVLGIDFEHHVWTALLETKGIGYALRHLKNSKRKNWKPATRYRHWKTGLDLLSKLIERSEFNILPSEIDHYFYVTPQILKILRQLNRKAKVEPPDLKNILEVGHYNLLSYAWRLLKQVAPLRYQTYRDWKSNTENEKNANEWTEIHAIRDWLHWQKHDRWQDFVTEVEFEFAPLQQCATLDELELHTARVCKRFAEKMRAIRLQTQEVEPEAQAKLFNSVVRNEGGKDTSAAFRPRTYDGLQLLRERQLKTEVARLKQIIQETKQHTKFDQSLQDVLLKC